MYEALYYRVVDTDKKIVQCQLCPHNCIIKDNMHGYCGSRKNLAAKLYCLSYGQITGQQLDPIEKKPLYHFYPNTKIFSIGS
jgi:pyruvate formate lyase activating enzyme